MKPILLLAALLTGCYAPSSSLNKISLGMTKAEVIKALGPPASVSAIKGVEYLNYEFSQKPAGFSGGALEPHGTYFVRLIDGRVEAYGQKGDFDSTKPDIKTLHIRTGPLPSP